MNVSDQLIDRVTQLPSAPTVVTKLLQLFQEEDRDLDAVVELITHDPSLTVEVLKRCNSASLGGAMAISDMFDAVTRLGFYEVYRMTTALVGARSMSFQNLKGVIDTSALWRHSVITAVASETLAKWVGAPEAMAFTAGLLHDIGKLILASVEGPTYSTVLKQVSFGPGLAQAEQDAFGVNHACVGARLMDRWNLPECITGAVLHHDGSAGESGASDQMAATIRLANNLAHDAFGQHQANANFFRANAIPAAVLQLKDSDMPKLKSETRAGVKRVESLLQMAA